MKKSEKKVLTGGLNSDFTFNSPGFAADDYVDKLNRRYDESIEGSAGADVNIPSTVEIPVPVELRPQNQVYTVIGYKEDRAKNRGFIFYHGEPNTLSDLPCHHVLELNFATKQYTTVLMNGPQTGGKDVLNFSKDHLILHIDIVEDKLYWTEGFNDPRKINVETAKITRAYFFTVTGDLASNTLTATGMGTIPAGQYNITVATPRPRRYTVASISGNTITTQEKLLKLTTNAPAYLYSGYGLITKELLKNIKAQPIVPLSARYTLNGNNKINAMKGKMFQFRYRYIYRDNEISSLSTSSVRPIIEVNYNDLDVENNGIRIGFNTGSSDVAKVEIFARVGLLDYFSIVVIDKLTSPDYADDCYCFFDFFNNGIYNNITTQDQIKIADEAVPYLASTQALLNKNYLGYGNITQGQDTISEKEADAEFSPIYGFAFSTKKKEINIRTDVYTHKYYTAGFVINVVNEVIVRGEYYGSPPHAGTYLFKGSASETGNTPEFSIVPDDSLYRVGFTQNIIDGLSASGYTVYNNEFNYPVTDGFLFVTKGINILARNPISGTNFGSNLDINIRHYKSGDQYQWGIQYFDLEGRRIGGVVTKSTWLTSFPNFNETQDGITNDGTIAGIKYNIKHKPPIGAHSYALVRTNNLYKTSYLQWMSYGTHGSSTLFDTDTTIQLKYSNIFLYQKYNSGITNVNYEPKDGDICRLIGSALTTTPPNATYSAITPFTTPFETSVIPTRQFEGQTTPVEPYVIRIKKPDFITSADTVIVFEVYTPNTAGIGGNQIFYECGLNYPVLNPGKENRSHFSNQNGVAFGGADDYGVEYNGDHYITQRAVPDSDITTGIDGNFGKSILNMEAPFYNDFYDSTYSNNGRALVVDPYAGRKERPVTVVNSRQNVYQTSINGLSSFDDDQFLDGDIQYGSIQRLHSKEGNLEIYQEDRCADMPINQQQQVDNFSETRMVNSVTVLNKIQYNPVSDYSIGKNPESFWPSYNSRYFVDVKRGKVIRRGNDGLTPISDYKQMTYFGNICQRFIAAGNKYIFGGGDRNNEKYLVYFPIDGETEGTRAFSEKYNRWTERYSFYPEFFGNFNNELITFKQGKTYLHDSPDAAGYNSFHGQPAVNGSITIVFNQAPEDKKTFHALRLKPILVNTFSVPEIKTSLEQLSELLGSDFKAYRMEGISHAGLLRDKNTPNIPLPLNYGDHLKGAWIQVKLVCEDNTKKNELYSVELLYITTSF